ncbi:MAG: hypothetical protein M3N29_05260 [Chloroflexota bacterium]|nr:hypothetical protein [Chloroflexota bacterium]
MKHTHLPQLARTVVAMALPAALVLAAALPVSAHEHFAEPAHGGDGQVLANGQNHPRFIQNTSGTFESCEEYGPIAGSSIGPAWYGLETAHHGPDAGTPGKGDGCYAVPGGLSPLNPLADRNPAIR